MRILFIGGTQFVGRAMAERAVADGNDVTLVHRGNTGAELFPDATHVLADRNGDLDVLSDGEWDVTIDVAAYLPRQVTALADALDGRGGHHVFISTVSVYAGPPGPDADEDAPLWEAAGDDVGEVTAETYGPLKVACEQRADERYGDALTIVRPTYVIGPNDHTGRFPWWVLRMARGGEVLAPGPVDQPMQVIDARDMADWTLRLATDRVPGAFTAARPWIRWCELLEATASAVNMDDDLTWVDADWLTTHDTSERDFPLWAGSSSEWSLAMSTIRADDAGLHHRPLEETITDTLAWTADVGTDAATKTGLGISAEREASLLAEWHASR